MKVLHVNKFHYPRGGSEAIYFGTAQILESHNHASSFFSMHHPVNLPYENSAYFMPYLDLNAENKGIVSRLKTAARVLYSFEAKKRIEGLIRKEKPDIAHLHNIHHQISPSILHTLKRFGIPVVMTLHDYKMVCASYSMLAHGKICQACKGAKYYYCFLKGCVKDSRAKSLLSTVEMYLHHKLMHIYDLVNIFVAPSIFLKDKLKELGFKRNIEHVPNFVDLDEFSPQYNRQDNSIIYLGRLSPEKGLFTLIEAVKDIKNITLKIIGEGPLRSAIESKIQSLGCNNIELLGYRKGEDLKELIRKAMFMVLPSECYENNPRCIIEGFALGKPAIGARMGGIPELVRDNVTGLLFEAGISGDLKDKIAYLKDNPDKMTEMGRNARGLVEKEYDLNLYYQRLMRVYESVL